MRRGGTAVSVSRIDRLHSEIYIQYLAGPFADLLGPEQVLARLRTVAAQPGNRVGLRPERGSRRWAFDPQCGHVGVTQAPGLADADAAAAVQAFAATAPSDAPIDIRLAGDHVLVNFDHGLGDATFFNELVASFSAGGRGFTEPAPLVNCRKPMTAAVAHGLRAAPWSLAKSLGSVSRTRRPASPTPPAPVASPESSVAYARSPVDFLGRIRSARRRTYPDVSLIALLTAAFIRSLHRHGIATTGEVDMLVDLRRYLPAGKGTLSMFASVAPMQGHSDPRRLADELTAFTDGHLALTRQLAHNAVSLIKPVPPAHRFWCNGQSAARLAVSDFATRSAMDRMQWQPDRRRVFLARVPCTFSNQIALAIARIEEEVHITASFHGSTFERDVVSDALAAVGAVLAEDFGLADEPWQGFIDSRFGTGEARRSGRRGDAQ